MILIQEIAPAKKISGLTSMVISFDYNPYIIDVLKGLPTYYYHSKDKVWEIPVCYLGRVLDALTFYDDITLKLLDTPEEGFLPQKKYKLGPLTEEELKGFKATPFNHQIEAVNFLLDHERALLLDGCGTGKSLTMILLAETLKRRGIIDHCLVICGICSLRSNWEKEINKFSTEKCKVIGKYITRNGTTRFKPLKERAQQLKDPIDEFFVIINIEALRSDEILEAIRKSKNNFGLMLCDEAHKIGNKTNSQANNLLKLSADFMVPATGTLITNNPLSAYTPSAWIKIENATLTTFKSQYCNFGGFGGNQITGFKNLEVLREVIAANSIRRTLYDVREDMPPRIVDPVILEMDDEQRRFYEAIKEGVKEEADKVELKSSNLLALTTRLRQATVCPAVLTTQDIESVKIQRAIEMTEELVEQGEKVVIFSNFKEPLYQLAAKLSQFRLSVNTGDTPDSEIARNVEKFQEDPNEQVFLASYSKMGTGWTLNSAANMICLDTPFTYAMLEQALERIHRINNTRPAYVSILVCEGTIDERVQEIVESKKDLGEFLVDGEGSYAANTKLSDELYAIIKSL